MCVCGGVDAVVGKGQSALEAHFCRESLHRWLRAGSSGTLAEQKAWVFSFGLRISPYAQQIKGDILYILQ